MNEDLDKKLHEALRPVDPGEEFTARVLAKVGAEADGDASDVSHASDFGSARGVGAGGGDGEQDIARRRVWPLVGSVAATLVVAGIVTHQWWQERREERAGAEAREQVLEALRVTSEKLDLAYQMVNNP
jgi:hypothetical protein